ncbi:hypothetical protein [Paenibacillus piri]|uniref:DUF2269 family protein n=1 Tax=Paenibacillus piri TaxID=2547395 RepID=A0A4R5KU37_9BACL|nr:hypothetical protein [Paenibacillus piri]TDF99429.1 hypothetical protein E1757_06140 [Paenibacillus piri]
MFGVMLFSHLTGLFIWIGSLFATIVMLLMLKKQISSQESKALAQRIIKVFSWFAHPGSVVVLASGVFMIVQLGLSSDKPFWLSAMEKGGGMIVLLSLILTGIWGGKVKKQLRAGQGHNVKLTGYLTMMSIIVILIILIMLIVSMKI